MKKLLLLLSCLIMVFAVHAQQHAAQGNTAYTIDPQATAAAPWKVGETIAEEPCSADWEITCYSKFLGITAQGKALLQEFYASGPKATEPFTATVLPETEELRRDGLYIALHENGPKAAEGYYQDGKQQGLWTLWHENGQKMGEIHYQDGKPHGLWTLWHKNGQKGTEGHFQDGDLQGLWTRWDENGNIIEEKNYD